MGYKLALFDFDGTLADTFPWILGILDHLAGQFDLPRLPESEIETLRGLDTLTILKRYQISVWKLAAITRHTRALMERDIHRLQLFPGMADSLHRLAERDVRLGIVSSNGRANIEQMLGAELARRIDYYECGVSIFGKTPRLRKVLQQSGLSTREVIYIGDETRDAQAAHRTGIHFGAVAWGYARLETLLAHAPDRIFYHVGDLAEQLAPC